MPDPQKAAEQIAKTFERILQEQMQGIPLLNNMLRVQTLGFQEYQGRVLGILVTPWLMNMVMLPGEEDDWEALELGKKIPQKFPSRTYKFMVNDIDGIGKCQTYSLHSPMHEFVNQDHAIAAAQSVLDTLMVESELSEEEKVDEELLGRILRGEETPGLDGVASVEAAQPAPGKTEVLQPQGRLKEAMSRRDLLRGVVLGDG